MHSLSLTSTIQNTSPTLMRISGLCHCCCYTPVSSKQLLNMCTWNTGHIHAVQLNSQGSKTHTVYIYSKHTIFVFKPFFCHLPCHLRIPANDHGRHRGTRHGPTSMQRDADELRVLCAMSCLFFCPIGPDSGKYLYLKMLPRLDIEHILVPHAQLSNVKTIFRGHKSTHRK